MKPDFSLYDDYEQMFGPQVPLVPISLDVGLDEFRDDPLNISELFRSLIKSLPVIPADNKNNQVIPKSDIRMCRKNNSKMQKKTNTKKEDPKKKKPINKSPKFPANARFVIAK
jgi:hypothetical protein